MRRSKVYYAPTLLLAIPLFLYIDSPYFADYFKESQHLATLLVSLAFFYLYKRSNTRTRAIMLIGVVVGLTGEFLFSKVLGMYHYRLDNIPLWVGFGHSLIFAAVHRIIRRPFFLDNKEKIQKYSLLFIFFYASAWLVFANDLFGFMTTMAFLILLLFVKKSRLFFTIMFLIVCYIEVIGTTTMSWWWPTTLMGIFENIPSANPPSGIAIFYFLFDFAVLHTYLFLNPQTRKRYKRRKVI
ncbi:MAG: hypothetical protein U9N39_06425 [Campylobacterota bacterium]|nr:hypothetical protein [Campylobacterota bacterium]